MANLDLAGIITRVCTDLRGKFAALSHTHGSITNAGAITSDTAVASGDKLVITDSSDSSKLKRSSLAFGSSTSTFLRNDGSWATPSGGGGGSAWVDVSAHFDTRAVTSFLAYCNGSNLFVAIDSWAFNEDNITFDNALSAVLLNQNAIYVALCDSNDGIVFTAVSDYDIGIASYSGSEEYAYGSFMIPVSGMPS